MENEEFERVIKISDTISLHVKINNNVDIATVNTELAILTKIAKVVDNVEHVEGLMTTVPTKRAYHKKYRKVELNDEQKKQLVADFDLGMKMKEIAQKWGFSTPNAAKCRINYIKKTKVKSGIFLTGGKRK